MGSVLWLAASAIAVGFELQPQATTLLQSLGALSSALVLDVGTLQQLSCTRLLWSQMLLGFKCTCLPSAVSW